MWIHLKRSRHYCFRAAGTAGQLRHCLFPSGLAVTPPSCIRRVPGSINTRTYGLLGSTVSTCRKSTAKIPAAWVCRNCRQVGPARCGAGAMPAAFRIPHTVDGATATPSFASSPWIRRYTHGGFSFAKRTARRPADCQQSAGLAPLAHVVLVPGQCAMPGQQRRRRHGK
jgi:hypothetical protein